MGKERVNKSPKKAKKCAQPARAELETIRKAIGHNKRGMAQVLGISYSAYQKYAGGQRPVPAEILTKARAEQKRDRVVMRQICAEIDQEIARRYPHGIPSVRVLDPE
jgi:predicted transcriptional regulator